MPGRSIDNFLTTLLAFLLRLLNRPALIGIVALASIALAAIQPFTLGQFPLTADGELHLYRLVSLDHAMQHGALWPRYVAGMAYGYGAPFFNYYAPLSLYPLEIFHLLGAAFVNAWLMGFVFYTLVGTFGAYLLGAAWTNRIGGIAAAVAYTYAPYTLFDSIWRGTVSESASIALLPWVFWGFWRLATYGKRRDWLAAVVSFALFIPMHNIITLHSAALLVVYCAYLWWMSGQDFGGRLKTGIRLMLAFVLALGLTAFFWLPALSETDYTKINGTTRDLSDIDVTQNLTTLGDVFAPPQPADPTQLQPPVPISLSWPQITLGLLALALTWRVRSSDDRLLRGWMWLSVALIGGLVFVNTESSAGVWRVVPLIRYSQFPWRLIGPASLLLALMAGAGVTVFAQRIAVQRARIAWIVLACVVMMVYAIPWLYSIYVPAPAANTIVDAQDFERETGWIATSSFGEYLPRWNHAPPDSDKLIARYAEADVIPRLDTPSGVTISSETWGLTSGDVTLQAESDTTVIFDWFYFPGWWATLDGHDLPLSPTEPEGLIQAAIPAGNHELQIGLGLTTTQAAATVISIISLVGLAGVLIFVPGSSPIVEQNQRARRLFLTTVAIGIGVFLVKALIIDHTQTPLRRERFAAGVADGVQNPVEANFGNQITLLGYDTPSAYVKSGQSTSIYLYWQLRDGAIDTDYSSVVTLRQSDGNIVTQTGSFYPGGLATSNWRPGYYLQEWLDLAIPPGTPPGIYTLDIGLFDPITQTSLNLINAQGNPEDVKVLIGGVIVTEPDSPPDRDQFEIDISLDADLNASIRLLGIQSLPDTLEVGQEFQMEWLWQALATPEDDYQIQLTWLDEAGQIAAASPDMNLVTDYPTGQWQPGDIWRGIHSVYVPGRLEAGDYAPAIQLMDSNGELIGKQTPISAIHVTTPERTFDIPNLAHITSMTWANGIRLLGYDVSQENNTANLTLYWQPQDELFDSLRVFVHVVDAEGIIVAQADGIPVDWTRPTTGWAPGEVIYDTARLTLPEDTTLSDFDIQIGWYDPSGGERVGVETGDVWILK